MVTENAKCFLCRRSKSKKKCDEYCIYRPYFTEGLETYKIAERIYGIHGIKRSIEDQKFTSLIVEAVKQKDDPQIKGFEDRIAAMEKRLKNEKRSFTLFKDSNYCTFTELHCTEKVGNNAAAMVSIPNDPLHGTEKVGNDAAAMVSIPNDPLHGTEKVGNDAAAMVSIPNDPLHAFQTANNDEATVMASTPNDPYEDLEGDIMLIDRAGMLKPLVPYDDDD